MSSQSQLARQAEAVADHVKTLWNTSAFFDLTLRLRDGHELKVHKNIVSKCDFFDSLCKSRFREARENLIEFPEDHAIGMEFLVRYLYGYTLEESHEAEIITREDIITGEVVPDWDSDLEYQVYVLARKYLLPDLAEMALLWLRGNLDISITGVRPRGQHSTGWYFLLARSIYNSEEDVSELRTVLLNGIRQNAGAMSNPGNARLVKQGLLMCPGLAVDLLMSGGFYGPASQDDDDNSQ